jgi:hypothetical protein
MDAKTRELYAAAIKRSESDPGIPYPQLLLELNVLRGFLYTFLYQKDYRQLYRDYAHNPAYADWYRIIAYTLYGYGNWSNNDRRRNGLPARRSLKSNRRKGLR